MPFLQTLDLILLLSLLIVAASLVPASHLILQIYLALKSRRLVDATDWAPAPPPPVEKAIDRLTKIGFTLLGVRSAPLLGDRRRFEWDLVGEPATTYVSLLPATAVDGDMLMVCHTAFPDDAFVATYFPTGVETYDEKLLAISTDESPEAALRLHREAVADFSVAHGAPLENRSMDDLLQRDATYRQLHAGATLRRRAYAYVAMATVLAMACGITIARLILID